MKALSSVVVLILIMLMIIFLGMMFWSYLSQYQFFLQSRGTNQTSGAADTISSCIRIEEASKNNFFIRNCGKGVVSNVTLNVFVDDGPVGFVLSPSYVGEGNSGTLMVSSDVPTGEHSLKITNPRTQATAYFYSDGSMNFRII